MRALWAIGFSMISFVVLAQVAEPDGYRGAPYRAEVPESLAGAVVVGSEDAYALWERGVVFVDVLPRAPKPENLPEGTIWRDQPRHSIPGAIWLPNVGYEALADVTMEYFEAGLAHASQGDFDAPLVFFCLEECWMSWNAAKRALALGYSEIYWYPQGTDGWSFMDYPLERLEPWVLEGVVN